MFKPFIFKIWCTTRVDFRIQYYLIYASLILDDSTIYRHGKAKDIKSCANILTSELSNILSWSSSNNLAFNAAKTKSVFITTSQIEKLHGFEQNIVELKWKDKGKSKRIQAFWIAIDKNRKWKKHVNNTTKNCHATLNVLRKIERYTPLPVRKQQASLLFYQN